MSSERIKVVLADDHALVSEALAKWLEGTPGIEVLAVVGTGDEAVSESERLHPDVALMDIDMPGLSCFDAARRIRQNCPDTRVVILSAHFHDRYIEHALAAEASGYVTKRARPDTIVEAIRTVAAGSLFFSPDVQARIVVGAGGPALGQPEMTRVSTLTPREIEVLRYVARGLSKKEIARTMEISAKTVDHHTANLMTKLNIHDRVELALFAVRERLTEP